MDWQIKFSDENENEARQLRKRILHQIQFFVFLP